MQFRERALADPHGFGAQVGGQQVVAEPQEKADEGGVNYTCGLPVIRTSPDHGTAFDIAGQNIASPDSMRTALFEAISIYRQRSDFEHYTANPIKRHSLSTER